MLIADDGGRIGAITRSDSYREGNVLWGNYTTKVSIIVQNNNQYLQDLNLFSFQHKTRAQALDSYWKSNLTTGRTKGERRINSQIIGNVF